MNADLHLNGGIRRQRLHEVTTVEAANELLQQSQADFPRFSILHTREEGGSVRILIAESYLTDGSSYDPIQRASSPALQGSPDESATQGGTGIPPVGSEDHHDQQSTREESSNPLEAKD